MKGIGRRTIARTLPPILACLLFPAALVAADGPVTVLTATQRREVTPVVRGDAELVPIDEVLSGLGVRLVTGRWLVAVEGLARVLPPLLERPVEWRAAQRVLVIGPVVIPKLTVSAFASAELVRVVFEASESVPFRVQQEAGRVTVAVPRDLVDVLLQPTRLAGGIVSSVQFLGGRENMFAVELGPRFQTLKATEQLAPARLVLRTATSTRSPVPANSTVCSPTMSPPRMA